MTSSKSVDAVLALVVGIGAGIVAGILMAPRGGRETREQIRFKMLETRNRMRDKVDEQKRLAQNHIADVADTAQDILDKSHGALDSAQEAVHVAKRKTDRTLQQGA